MKGSVTAWLTLTLLMVLLSSTPVMAMQCPLLDVTVPMASGGNSDNAESPYYATAMKHQFDSGASWEFCWHIDEHAGLTISNIHYGPPAEPVTKVIESASLAQILFKYDEDLHADHILSSVGPGTNHVPPDTSNCPAGNSHVDSTGSGVCVRLRDVNTMTSVRRSEALRRHELSLHAVSNVDSKIVEQIWRFSEDGQITPAVRMSGELSRFTYQQQYGTTVTETGPLATNAALLFTWRLDFNIGDTPNNDIVEQIEFVPQVSNGVRRSINTTALATESFHKVHRTQFRGWLIRDAELSAGPLRATRMGYYLDPQSSGFDYISRQNNWAMFDLILTRNHPCERLASENSHAPLECGNSLDQFVNGESLENQDPVVWFSLARQFLPKAEDYPAITTRIASFKLIPFDWSASTPFTPLIE